MHLPQAHLIIWNGYGIYRYCLAGAVIKVHHGFIDHEDGNNPGKWPPRIQLNANVNNDKKILTSILNVNKRLL
jgi:hypothetical protein